MSCRNRDDMKKNNVFFTQNFTCLKGSRAYHGGECADGRMLAGRVDAGHVAWGLKKDARKAGDVEGVGPDVGRSPWAGRTDRAVARWTGRPTAWAFASSHHTGPHARLVGPKRPRWSPVSHLWMKSLIDGPLSLWLTPGWFGHDDLAHFGLVLYPHLPAVSITCPPTRRIETTGPRCDQKRSLHLPWIWLGG